MEDELIKRCQQGERDAFERLFQLYERKARQTAYLITNNLALVDDITQEAFIQCYKHIQSLRQTELFQVWFYQILVRVSFRMLQKEKKRWNWLHLGHVEELPSSPEKGYEAVESKDTYLLLYRALNSLSQTLRTVVILHYFNELSIKEISEILDCREGTVKSRLHNARKKLLEKIEKQGVTCTQFNFEKEEEGFVRQMVKSHVK